MNITNAEMTQASLELFAGCVYIMLSLIIVMNRHKQRSMKMFVWMFLTISAIFFLEAGAYIFRGNTNTLSLIMTRVTNFGVFALNILLANLFVRFVYSVLSERGVKPAATYQIIANILFTVVLIILVSNIFAGWMYYFDANNFYHRNFGWYIYTCVNFLCFTCGSIAAIKHRKEISISTLISILVYTLAPVITIVVQSFVYGISIINIGLGLAALGMLFVYLTNWSKMEYIDQETDDKARKLLEIIALFVIMVVCMSASIISCVLSISRITKQIEEDDNKIVGHMVGASIENQFEKPIIVSKTLARDYNLKEYIKQSNEGDAEAVKEDVAKCLESIRKGFGYQMVYVVSEVSRAYYTYDGISKYVDTVNDPHDIWYKDFIESGREYELNVDTDEDNNWSLSVFVNTLMRDDENKVIAACGVGVNIGEIQSLIKKYESEYNIKIQLVDKNGTMQVSADASEFENIKADCSYFDKVNSSDFYYVKNDGKLKLTKYIENLDWYLVIENNSSEKYNVRTITMPSIIIFVAGLFMMALTFGIITVREQKTSKELREKHMAARTDVLTGLLNRHAYEEDLQKIEVEDRVKDTTIVMLDVNRLKYVNDNLGHNAGDELIIGAANCMRNIFNKHGKVYRVGGDEFVALLSGSNIDMKDIINTFEYITSTWRGKLVEELSISKGYISSKDYPELSLHELIEQADKFMYADKAAYYARTGNERRK